ncbi:MAG: hypothetical protein KAJ70_05325 [Candidatus Omnitrophica bacterium]|nr:hypothetical protein [Candidatus Omnitrophota bacterium]
MRKGALFARIICGCFLFTAVLAVQSTLAVAAVAEEEAELMPMELDGTMWDVEMTFTNKKGKKETSQDTLIFEDKTLISEVYKKEGHTPTNYSVSVKSNGVTKYGTMNVHEGKKYFWNGQVLEDKTMRGNFSVLDSEGGTKEYYFKGKLSSGVLKRKDPKPAVQEPAQPVVEAVKPPVK